MKILIIYATIEGQTRKIARFMESVLQKHQHQVVIADATEEPPTPDGFDVVLIGSSIHKAAYNPAVVHYVKRNISRLNTLPTAFFSVCLAVVSGIEKERVEIETLAAQFLAETGWQAQRTSQIAGALKYTKYDYFKRLIMKMIADKNGGDTDTSTDHEYTDWQAVESFVLTFISSVEKH